MSYIVKKQMQVPNLLKYKITIILISISTILIGQNKYDYNWMLGRNFSDSLEGSEGSLINFNESPPSISYRPFFPELTLGGSVSISNGLTGELQFYSNGCVIFDKSHQLMMNGDNINPGHIRDQFCDQGLFYYPQLLSMIGLPNPENINIYHLIHTSIRDSGDTISISDTLRITTIDGEQNDSKGKVISKNKVFFTKRIEEQINACKHNNNKDWWVVSHLNKKNTFAKFLLTGNGIAHIDTQSIGLAPTPRGYQGSFSPDGNLYAWYGGYNELQLFDFERATGEFSNYRSLFVTDTIDSGGLAFSPSGRFIYCTTATHIYQVDLENLLGEAEVIEVATLELPPPSSFTATFKYAMLGPDCRIYVGARNSVRFLTTIDYPDIKGVDCTVKQYDFELPYNNFLFNIPNNPHYRIDEPYPCTYSTDAVDYEIKSNLETAPNPATNTLIVKSKIESPFVIYDMQGGLKLNGILNRLSTNIDISSLSSGMYVIICKETKAHARFVKI